MAAKLPAMPSFMRSVAALARAAASFAPNLHMTCSNPEGCCTLDSNTICACSQAHSAIDAKQVHAVQQSSSWCCDLTRHHNLPKSLVTQLRITDTNSLLHVCLGIVLDFDPKGNRLLHMVYQEESTPT